MKLTDEEIRAWAERHGLNFTLPDLRCMMEDAQSLRESVISPEAIEHLYWRTPTRDWHHNLDCRWELWSARDQGFDYKRWEYVYLGTSPFWLLNQGM